MADDGLAFATPQDWQDWLAVHHAREAEVWVMFWKKASGVASIDWQQAVVEALCWGWIDGVVKSVDKRRFRQRFTPRRPQSTWSNINKSHVERLTAQGRMQAPGLAVVAAAKANGRWEASYSAGLKGTEIPADFLAALAAGPPSAQLEWDALDTKNRFAIYYRVTTAKRAETRARKVAEFVAMLARGERPV